MNLLKTYKLKNLNLRNKSVMPPMCMYSADENGLVNNFHKIHYGARALGGLGLIILEATAVDPKGRISDQDLGIWSNLQVEGLAQLVDIIHTYGAQAGIQIAHAGRKSQSKSGPSFAPSPLAYDSSYRLPQELSKSEIQDLIISFQEAARRADLAGFDLLEIHAAHGYLIHEFLSPLSNHRQDAYGGSLENRTRFLREVLAGVKKVWPSDKVISLRVSATDYLPGGLEGQDLVEIIRLVKPFIDLVHVSTGGLLPAEIPIFDGYQVDYSSLIRSQCEIPTIAVGLINDFDLANKILDQNQADLIAFGRKVLREPQYILNEIYKHKYIYDFPQQYERAYRYRSADKLREI